MGVGLTAFMVAAARAIETHRHDALAQDFYAEQFVRAAPACDKWPVRIEDVPNGDANPLWGRLGRYFGLRMRVFDDYLLAAAHTGVRQVVLLGAGFDSRAFRLGWPKGCVVFELDQDPILRFKQEVLDGSRPQARRIAIATDLTGNWADQLISAGFDPAGPSVWLAEGLLLYLPSEAERRLVNAVDRLAAAGSTLAYEIKVEHESPDIRASAVYASTRQQIGVDLLALFDGDARPDSAADLTVRGWSTETYTPYDFTRKHGKGPLPEPRDALAANRWVFADKPR